MALNPITSVKIEKMEPYGGSGDRFGVDVRSRDRGYFHGENQYEEISRKRVYAVTTAIEAFCSKNGITVKRNSVGGEKDMLWCVYQCSDNNLLTNSLVRNLELYVMSHVNSNKSLNESVNGVSVDVSIEKNPGFTISNVNYSLKVDVDMGDSPRKIPQETLDNITVLVKKFGRKIRLTHIQSWNEKKNYRFTYYLEAKDRDTIVSKNLFMKIADTVLSEVEKSGRLDESVENINLCVVSRYEEETVFRVICPTRFKNILTSDFFEKQFGIPVIRTENTNHYGSLNGLKTVELEFCCPQFLSTLQIASSIRVVSKAVPVFISLTSLKYRTGYIVGNQISESLNLTTFKTTQDFIDTAMTFLDFESNEDAVVEDEDYDSPGMKMLQEQYVRKPEILVETWKPETPLLVDVELIYHDYKFIEMRAKWPRSGRYQQNPLDEPDIFADKVCDQIFKDLGIPGIVHNTDCVQELKDYYRLVYPFSRTFQQSDYTMLRRKVEKFFTYVYPNIKINLSVRMAASPSF